MRPWVPMDKKSVANHRDTDELRGDSEGGGKTGKVGGAP